MAPWQIDTAMLGMAGSAATAVCVAGWKAFTVAAKFGRMLERSEQNEQRIALIPALVTLVDSLKSMVGQLAGNHSELKETIEKLDSDFGQLRVDVARLDGSIDVMRESSGDYR